MNSFQGLVSKFERTEAAKDHFNQQVVDSIFQEQRDRAITTYCAMIRFHYEIRRRNASMLHLKPFTFDKRRDDEDPGWCNAAVHILTVGDQSIQRFFLASDMQIRSRMVQAVIDDQGMCRADDFFVELPPL